MHDAMAQLSVADFQHIHNLYTGEDEKSMDAKGVVDPTNEDQFLKIIQLDVTSETNPNRGLYDVNTFKREVVDAQFAHEIGIGPKVHEYYVTYIKDDTQYGVIAFERLHASLESLIVARRERVEEKFALHTPTLKTEWGDMSDETETSFRSRRSSIEPVAAASPASPARRESLGATYLNATLADFLPRFREMLWKMDQNGFFHLDMHPGNFFYKENNGEKTWYLIDYGLVQRCTTFPCQMERLGKPRFDTREDLLAYSVRVFRRETTELYDDDDAVTMWNILETFLRSGITHDRAPLPDAGPSSPPGTPRRSKPGTATPPTRPSPPPPTRKATTDERPNEE